MAPACVTWGETLRLSDFQTHHLQVQGVDVQSERHCDDHKNSRWTLPSRRGVPYSIAGTIAGQKHRLSKMSDRDLLLLLQ